VGKNKIIPEVSEMHFRKMIAHVDAPLDKDALYAKFGLLPDTDADPARMVNIFDYFSLLEILASYEKEDISFHMRACQSMTCEDYGVLGLAWKSAPTLNHSFMRLSRYTKLYNKVSFFEFANVEDTVRWRHYKPDSQRLGDYLSSEGTLATFLMLCREATSDDFSPLYVNFRHQPLRSVQAVEDHFRAPINYGADIDELVFCAEEVDKPNTFGEDSIWRFFIKHLEDTYQELDDKDAIDRQVVDQVVIQLSEGIPTLSEVASQLGMGARTLQRRLAERNRTFQSLVDEARRELAGRLISKSEYSLAEIAFITGFSEQSSFTRAFKRWNGQTPREYRVSAL
jgi:AraC-like DNA-binding protein